MSVSELPIPHQDPTRTPPQDVAAEQSVIGAMLLSKDAIADVVEQVREHDFYRPIIKLYFLPLLICIHAGNQQMQ